MECMVNQIDAFTSEPGQGNPAGVILNGDDYSEEQMQNIAAEVGFNECVFVCASNEADIKLRYFTPGHETPLCGHATVGAIYLLSQPMAKDQEWKIETGAGILNVLYQKETQSITMEQSAATFIPFEGDPERIAQILGIQMTDLAEGLPLTYGNTGSWTFIVPVKNEAVLDKMTPLEKEFPKILSEMPRSSIHPFAFVEGEEDVYSARHFSSPFSGTTEDSVTGTASGVMAAYLLNHRYSEEAEKQIFIRQGKHVGREGELTVLAKKSEDGHHNVSITGTACKNKTFSVRIN
ncbi:PhzF family phenazine biosynthesis protein [Enterococcus sp. CWB-B31]|uniref:PhzF family phenazine biosynthesis protein n=1 Tax=Enterococcus sp. CWB-B31 TaxID=2885159 RepID=UPI001E38080D|nr:PhzF family phenazine biosynthesis isomerase [Enterococcus sp. CWB-B31]MCB5955977.1 PhzF family phenazine biosynthesis isomerase [Enterococcus sp. CWB-B31]